MFDKENIVYEDDLRRLNLSKIKDQYRLGKVSLEKLVKLILDNELYEDPREIQEFVIKNKLNTNKSYKEITRGY